MLTFSVLLNEDVSTSFKSSTPRRGIGRSRDDIFGPSRMKPSKENLEPSQLSSTDHGK